MGAGPPKRKKKEPVSPNPDVTRITNPSALVAFVDTTNHVNKIALDYFGVTSHSIIQFELELKWVDGAIQKLDTLRVSLFASDDVDGDVVVAKKTQFLLVLLCRSTLLVIIVVPMNVED
jgi:hypothetical protein